MSAPHWIIIFPQGAGKFGHLSEPIIAVGFWSGNLVSSWLPVYYLNLILSASFTF